MADFKLKAQICLVCMGSEVYEPVAEHISDFADILCPTISHQIYPTEQDPPPISITVTRCLASWGIADLVIRVEVPLPPESLEKVTQAVAATWQSLVEKVKEVPFGPKQKQAVFWDTLCVEITAVSAFAVSCVITPDETKS